MDQRYFLRFESGERKGETIPIPASGLTIGRRPGHTLQITDSSVSGNHAELRVVGGQVLLKDLGSTNGTRVEGQRVQEQRLQPGERLQFGSVELFFGADESADSDDEIQLELEEEPTAPVRAAAPAARSLTRPAPESAALPATPSPRPADALPAAELLEGPAELGRVSAEHLARSAKVSRPGLVVVALALMGGGVWYWLQGQQGGAQQRSRAVEPVIGNLLSEDYSFESDRDSWSGVEGAPQAFLRNVAAAYSGDYGLSCDLGAQEWARTRSKLVSIADDKELVASAQLRARGGVRVRLGLEFSQGLADEGARLEPITIFARPIEAGAYERVEWSTNVPPGYDRARLVMDARAETGAGSAAFDDASVLMRGKAPAAAAELGEARLFVLGEPAAYGLFARGGTLGISALELREGAEQPALALEASAEATRFRLVPQGSGRFSQVRLRVDAALAGRGLATLGMASSGMNGGASGTKAAAEAGFRSHGASGFERDNVARVLLGSGRDLVALETTVPARVRALREDKALVLQIDCPQATALTLQVDFRDERKSAQDLAAAARAAEKKGELGNCIQQWNALLDSYPFEEPLVREAEETRARLGQQGLSELRELAQALERARFFQLPELFEQCRIQMMAIAQRYTGSEVERATQEQMQAMETELSGSRARLRAHELERLQAILGALEGSGSKGLAEQVRRAITAQQGGL
jgi:hypothetical protein